MGSIRVSRLSSDFLEDTVNPFLKASDRSLSCLSDLDDTDKNPKSEGTVIIALGIHHRFGYSMTGERKPRI